jgi:hypothetical protein
MLAAGQSEKTVVARLRVRGAGLDASTARLRLAGLLQSVRLRPASLPPSAILVIKQIRDPLPGSLRLHQSGLLRPPQSWEHAVDELLEQLLRRAGRPALGPVDETALAVVFIDRSELLACLASDWCRSGALERWWWRSLLGDRNNAQAVARMWIEASAYAPAALVQLARRGEAAAFTRALREADSRLLLRSIIRSFALREIEATLDALGEVKDSAPGSEPAVGQVNAAMLQSGPSVSSFGARHRPPWSKAAPEAEGSGLRPDAECLLGIGLMLQRAPTAVRSREFARALLSWQLAVAGTARTYATHAGESKSATALSEAEQGAIKRAQTTNALTEKGAADFKFESLSDDRHRPPGAPTAAAPSGDDRIHTYQETDDGLAGTPHQRLIEGESEQAFIAQPLEETQYETQFGGLFYLINLGIFLGLYGDFTSPAETAPPLSIWDFTALVGRELLGEQIEDDPVWPLLAALAGRTQGQSPGYDFTAPDSLRVPVDWLSPFAEKSRWQWDARGGRLRVWHAKGFDVIDVPLSSDEPAEQQLLRETEAYRGAAEFELLPAALPEEPETKPTLETKPALSQWLGRLMPYVRVRLKQALGPTSDKDLAHVLCRHHARIICTATHLDIFLSLAQLPVAVRLSGLDRDPGWVPAAGKFIAFHFE